MGELKGKGPKGEGEVEEVRQRGIGLDWFAREADRLKEVGCGGRTAMASAERSGWKARLLARAVRAVLCLVGSLGCGLRSGGLN